MNFWFAAVLQLCVMAPLEGEWETLQGERLQGALTRLSADEAVVQVGKAERKLPLGDVLQFSRSISKVKPVRDPREGVAQLTDGSTFGFLEVESAEQGKTLAFKTPRLGTIRLETKAVRSLRIGPAEGELGIAWSQLAEKTSRDDRLVVRKEKVLDFLTGVIGELDAKGLKFLLENEEINVKRERIYGLIYARPVTDTESGIAVDVEGLDLLKGIRKISGDPKEIQLELSGGGHLTLAPEVISRADFSAGKLQYLSAMTPRDVQYQAYFDVIQPITKDRNLDGGPIRLDGKTYSRGVCLHSKTILKYEIPEGFRRFQTVAGIDQSLRLGDVLLIIRGDDKELFRGRIQRKESAKPLDLDIAGVRELEITVDFGDSADPNRDDVGDHLDLADARVIK